MQTIIRIIHTDAAFIYTIEGFVDYCTLFVPVQTRGSITALK